MRLRYYPIGIGALVLSGLTALFVVRATPDPATNESEELPDRFVEMLIETPSEAPAANPDAGEGARAKREEGKVGKKDARLQRARGNRVEPQGKALDRQISENAGVLGSLRDAGDLDGMFGSSGLDSNLSGGMGGLIGAKGVQTGAGGIGYRGTGLGGGGTAQGLGGLGTKGYGSGRSGYGVGGGSFGAKGANGSLQGPFQHTPPASTGPLAKEWTDVGHNPVELVEKDYLSTFSIDVDTASYTQARRQLQGQVLPPPSSVRTEEFVNYLRYDYPEPDRDQPFSITMDGAEHPWLPGHHIVRVGIKGAEDQDRSRQPVHLTFLVDVSGSMRSADKLPLAKRALVHLVDNLEEGDTVAIATYAGGSRVVLSPTDAAHKGTIEAAIRGLQNGGGTAMHSGMQLAYDMALKTAVPGEENRVIVLSDGDANIGATSHEQILGTIEGYAKKGITLSTVGFGTGNYRDTLMEQLADKGDGNYSYVDDFDEAKRIFGEDMGATLRTIARDVKIQVEFDSRSVMAYKLIGYENRAIADKDFRNDAVDAGEVGAGHRVTALYDLVLRDQPSDRLATVRVRHKDPGPDSPAREQAIDLPSRAVDRVFDASGRDLRRGFAMSAFAEKLRGAKQLEEVDWDAIAYVAETASRPNDDRDQEMVALIRTAQRLDGEEAELHAEVASAPPSSTSTGDPIILGALDRSLIDEVIRRHGNQIAYCYQRELTKYPSLAGRITTKFVIAKDGSVSSSQIKTSTMGNETVESCVNGRFMRMQFPRPVGGGIVIVSYPFAFSPSRQG